MNTDRSVGGRISGSIASQWGNKGFSASGGELELRFKGSAGQSFGAFNLPGVSLRLMGEANDYVGKGINGGQLVIIPHRWGAWRGCRLRGCALFSCGKSDLGILWSASEP